MSISIFVIFPILMTLMFMLGLELNGNDFTALKNKPKAITVGLIGQLVLLPLAAFIICKLMDLPYAIAIGLMLIAVSPGGNTSNILAHLAKGDAALSVLLTIISSFASLITIPLILSFSIEAFSSDTSIHITLPIKNVILQNLLLTVIPLVAGMIVKFTHEKTATRIYSVLKKFAYPLLIIFIVFFLAQFFSDLKSYVLSSGLAVFTLIISAMTLGWLLSKATRLSIKDRRTINIEISVQNVAQSMALATSPFIFDDISLTIPSIVYAFLMNIIILSYVKFVGSRS